VGKKGRGINVKYTNEKKNTQIIFFFFLDGRREARCGVRVRSTVCAALRESCMPLADRMKTKSKFEFEFRVQL
jgi:hypothetical protein